MIQKTAFKISVVIPAFNNAATISALLGSLKRQTRSADEIIVVDDGSSDETAALAESFDVTVLRNGQNRGAAFSRNEGIRSSTGNIVAFVDADCVPATDWIEQILNSFSAPEPDALVGSVQFFPKTRFARAAYALGWPAGGTLGFERVWHVAPDGRTEHLSSGNFAARRSVLEQYGAFDETCRTGGEDTELAERWARQGVRIYYRPEVSVEHAITCSSLDQFVKRHFDRGRSSAWFRKKTARSRFRRMIFDQLRVHGFAAGKSFRNGNFYLVIPLLMLMYVCQAAGYLAFCFSKGERAKARGHSAEGKEKKSERIAFIITPFPQRPVESGVPRYTESVIEYFRAQDYEVILFSPESQIPFPLRDQIFFKSRSPLGHFVNFSLLRTLCSEARRQKPDALIVISCFQALMVSLISALFKIPFIPIMSNIEYKRLKSIGRPITAQLVYWLERFSVQNAAEIYVISSKLRQEVLDEFHIDSKIIRHRPDPKRFHPVSAEEACALKRRLFPSFEKVVLFFGSLEYKPNREAAGFIYHRLADELEKSIPEVRFVIAGRNPPPLPSKANVVFTGLVDRIEDYIRAADLVIDPVVRGGGIQIKVLEAIACGKPIVASPFVCGGLEAEDRLRMQEIPLADFAREIDKFFACSK